MAICAPRVVLRLVGDTTASAPQPLAGLEDVEAYLEQHRVPHISWHLILNNHASTRPQAYGGKVVPAITKCKTFTQMGSGTWRCDLDMANSFAPGDGIRLQDVAEASSKSEAGDLVCRKALARLFLADPSQVVLRPGHWTVSPSELLAAMPGVKPGHQALPVHVPIRLREANSAQAEGLSPQEIDEKVAEILRLCLDTHGGQFNPSAIRHKLAGLKPEDERLYARLNKLLPPGQLRSFVDKHPEFAWMPRNPGQKRPGMIITWATAPGSASAGHAQDDQGTKGGGTGGAYGAAGAAGAGGTTGAGAAGGPSSRHPVERPHPEEWRQALPTPGAAGTEEARSLHLAEQRHLEEWRQALPTPCAIRPTVTSEADLVGRAGSAG